MLPLELEENGFDRRRSAQHAIQMRQSHRNTDDSRQQDSYQQGSTNFLHQQDGSNQQADNAQQGRTGSNISQ